jgi:outer membrane protein assembly factor BamB
MMRFAPLAVVCLAGLSVTQLEAAEWRHWRGPFYNGSTDEVDPPTDFSPTKNIRWATELPGPSAATPIVCKDSVFISSTDPQSGRLLAMCIERADGTVRWQREMGDPLRRDTRSTFAAPSPVTDGEVVVFFYGNGPLAAFDFQGKQLWKRNIQDDYGEFAFQWTFSSTPLLYEGKLYLQVLQRDTAVRERGYTDKKNESYLLALDPRSGSELWRVVRYSAAVAESREAFSSPIPFERGGRQEILIAGGDCLTGHDPETGQELWRWGTWNPSKIRHWRLVPSPVASEDIILACAPKKDPIYAIQAGGRGTLGDEAIAWVSDDVREITSDVATPAFYDGDFFVQSKERRCISRVEPQSGTVKWTTPFSSRVFFEASPTLVDGNIYTINFEGLVVILDAEDGSVIREIPMAEGSRNPIRSTIAVAGGNLFIRTNDTLYCVE